MASSVSAITHEHRNFAAVCRIITELFGDCLWSVLGTITDINSLQATLKEYVNGSKQWGESHIPVTIKDLCSSTHSICRNDCDVSVLYSIIRGLPKRSNPPAPLKGWGKEPSPRDFSICGDVERMRQIRNSCFAHLPSATLSDVEFQLKLQTSRDIVKRLDSKLGTKFENDLDVIETEYKTDKCLLDNYKRYIDEIDKLKILEKKLTEIEDRQDAAETRLVATETRQEEADKRLVAMETRQKETEETLVTTEMRQGETEKKLVATETRQEEMEKKLVATEMKQEETEKKLVATETKQEETEKKLVATETRQVETENKLVATERKQEETEKKLVATERKQEETEKKLIATKMKQDASEKRQEVKEQERMNGMSEMGGQISDVRKDIDSVKGTQVEQGERLEKLEKEQDQLKSDVTSKQKRIQEAEVDLRQYLVNKYQKELGKVKLSKFSDEVNIFDIYAPLTIREDLERWLTKDDRDRISLAAEGKTRGRSLVHTYGEIFYLNDVLQHQIFLVGDGGVGKTTFCQRLVNRWCQIMTKRENQGEQSKGQKSSETEKADDFFLESVDLVFYVTCRDIEKSKNVLDMIFEEVCPEKYVDLVKHIFKDCPDKCLVILDGLDELSSSSLDPSRLPNSKDVDGAVVLITSRQWRIESLQRRLTPACRVFEITGLDEEGVKKLSCSVLKKKGERHVDSTFETFWNQIKTRNMTNIVSSPLILTIVLLSWYKDQKSTRTKPQTLSRSISITYSNLLELIISHFEQKIPSEHREKWQDKRSDQLPMCFSKAKVCQKYGVLIEKLVELAFDTVLTNSVVFEKESVNDVLQDWFGEDNWSLCLSLGLLVESTAKSESCTSMVNISFVHKTVQEFLAAVHLCGISFDDFCSKFVQKVRNLRDIFDLEKVIVFLCGLDPVKGQKVCGHVSDVASQDEEFITYRQDDEYRDFSVKRLQNLLLQCITETEIFSDGSSQKPLSQVQVIIPDVIIDYETPSDSVEQLCDLVCKQGLATKSVVFDDKTETPLILVKALPTMTEIQKIFICAGINNASQYLELLCKAIESLKQLQSFGFSVTDNFPVTKSTCVLLVTALGKMPSLQSLKLKGLDLTAATESTLSPPPSCQSLSLYSVSVSSLNLTPTLQSVSLWFSSVSQLVLSELTIPSSLTVLNMYNVRLSSSDWRQLCGYLLHTHLLTELTLNPSFSDDVVTISDDVVTISDDVVTIYDDVVTISDDVVTISDDVVTISDDVVTISDDVVTISDEVQLKDNQSLQTLHLYHLCLESGLEIPNSSSLTDITMYSVKMSAECWKSFIHRLNRHPSQQLEVWLYYVNIDEDIVSDIDKYFTVTENWTNSDNTRNIEFNTNTNTETTTD